MKIDDITPKNINLISAREKILVGIEPEQLGATVGSLGDRLVSDVNKAIEAGGTVNTSVLNGTILLANLNVASMGWTQTCSFSVSDLDTVAWGTGVFTTSGGTSYTISAGNTGNMSARTYIYLDTAVSTTAYQVTTTATTAVGAGKVLIGTAINGTAEATFEIFGGIGGAHWAGNTIVANSITANQLATSLLYAGTLTIDTGGHIKCGMTDYLTGIGLFEGFSGGVPKWSVGNSSGDYAAFDGTYLSVNGSRLTFEAIFGDGSDGDVTIAVDTSLSSDMYYDDLTINSGKTLTCNGYRIFVKGTLTNNGTIEQNGNDGASVVGVGAGGAGGTATATGSILGGVAGGNGGNGGSDGNGAGGLAGTSITKGIGVNGIIGGRGGTRTGGGGGGSGGAAGTITGTIFNKVKNFTSAYNLFDIFPGSVILPFYSSAGSGGGGASCSDSVTNYTSGGGGGGSAGICWIAAKTIINGASGIISAIGGNGGNGGNGNSGITSSGGGGGAGGSGGVIIINYSSLTNSGTISVAGGTGGNGGLGYTVGVLEPLNNGVTGGNGNTGTIIYIKQ